MGVWEYGSVGVLSSENTPILPHSHTPTPPRSRTVLHDMRCPQALQQGLQLLPRVRGERVVRLPELVAGFEPEFAGDLGCPCHRSIVARSQPPWERLLAGKRRVTFCEPREPTYRQWG